MKKFFFMAAMASVALASCVNDVSDVAAEQQKEITFASPVVSLNSRAVDEIGTSYAVAGQEANEKYDFRVWAKYNTANEGWAGGTFYIGSTTSGTGPNGALVKYNSTLDGWSFNPNAYYWPKNGNLSFVAYSPASVYSNATVNDQGIQFTDYTVGTNADVDLLFSDIVYCKTKDNMNSTEPYKGLDIKFNHALSSIRFAVKTKEAYDGNTIIVKKIDVLNAYSVGDFNQTVTNGYNNQMASETNGWSGHGTEVNYNAYTGSITLTNSAKYVHNDDVNAGDNKTDLILLPQTLNHAVGNAVKVKVAYSMQNDSGGSAIDQETEFNIATSVTEWLRGKRYTYTIVFGLDEIYLDPSVTEWADVPGGLSDPTL